MRTSASTSALFVCAGIPRQSLYLFKPGPIVASDAISSQLKNWTAPTVCNNSRGCGTTAGVVTNHYQGYHIAATHRGHLLHCSSRNDRGLSLRAWSFRADLPSNVDVRRIIGQTRSYNHGHFPQRGQEKGARGHLRRQQNAMGLLSRRATRPARALCSFIAPCALA